jgi:hypothetical protein
LERFAARRAYRKRSESCGAFVERRIARKSLNNARYVSCTWRSFERLAEPSFRESSACHKGFHVPWRC